MGNPGSGLRQPDLAVALLRGWALFHSCPLLTRGVDLANAPLLGLGVVQQSLPCSSDDDDDNETFRKSPAAQGESLDKRKHQLVPKEPQADPECTSVKTTVLTRGNLFTRSCGSDSFPLERRNTVSSRSKRRTNKNSIHHLTLRTRRETWHFFPTRHSPQNVPIGCEHGPTKKNHTAPPPTLHT